MKSLPIVSAVICIALFSMHTTATAYDLTLQTIVVSDSALDVSEQPRLILALNAKELARYLNRTDTYTAQYDTPKNPEVASNAVQIDALSKKIKRVSKVFKRMTSLRYKNGQKIRAKIGRSSLILKYTRPL